MSPLAVPRAVPLRDELLAGNERWLHDGWEASFGDLAAAPAKELAVVACMDCRNPVEQVLGLSLGDAKVIRNAGNHVTDDTLRSLVVAIFKLGVKHVAVMGHTDCGMTTIGHGEFGVAKGMAARTEIPLHEAMRPGFQDWLGGFPDVAVNVQNGVELLRAHPYIPDDVDVFGLVYDNKTGRVEPIREDPDNGDEPAE